MPMNADEMTRVQLLTALLLAAAKLNSHPDQPTSDDTAWFVSRCLCVVDGVEVRGSNAGDPERLKRARALIDGAARDDAPNS